MIPEIAFLISLGQALSAAALYGDRHPAFRSAADEAFRSLLVLLEAFPAPRYSFLEGEVIFANRRLRELGEWHWARTLADAGAQRIEVARGVDREEFDRLLASLVEMLDPTSTAAEGSARIDLPHVRVGTLAVGERKRLTELEDGAEEPAEDRNSRKRRRRSTTCSTRRRIGGSSRWRWQGPSSNPSPSPSSTASLFSSSSFPCAGTMSTRPFTR